MAENLDALPAEAREAVVSGIRMTTDLDCFRDADFVLESIAENLEVKHAFYRQIEPMLKDTCLVTTNTSGLSITALVALTLLLFPRGVMSLVTDNALLVELM